MSLSSNNHFARVFELLLNSVREEQIHYFYGPGSSIKIVTLDFLPTKKVCNIYAKVILGDNFDDLSLETELAEMIVYEILADLLPYHKGTVSMSIES
jgi:hypothetical protein